MRVVLPNSPEAVSLRAKLSDWHYAIPPWGEPLPDRCAEEHDHWLGSSGDGRVWGMGIAPSAPRPRMPRSIKVHQSSGAIVAFLLDPPKREPDTIAKILFRVHGANMVGPLSDEQVESILRSTPFPHYLKVRAYLPGTPVDWLDWPAELAVGFGLSEGACLTPSLYEEFKRDNLRDALRVVCGPRQDGLLIGYSLAAREIVPHLRWNVDWPLARQGTAPPVRRKPVQQNVPWERSADLKLFSVYQDIRSSARTWAPLYYGRPMVRLLVGGRSRDDAVSNWHRCARALRRLKHS
jgi:hypothetical protein